jgi:hypothetical protein
MSDGQGRLLRAILFYINGDFKLEHNCFVIWEGKKCNIKIKIFIMTTTCKKNIIR